MLEDEIRVIFIDEIGEDTYNNFENLIEDYVDTVSEYVETSINSAKYEIQQQTGD